MRERQDVHRPQVFDPEAYDGPHGFADFHPEDGYRPTREIQELRALGFRFGGDWGGQHGSCGHCGAHIRYAALMSHPASKDLIWVGEQCFDNRFDSGMSKAEFQEMRKRAALNAERRAKVEKIAEQVEAHPVLAWLTYPDFLADSGEFVSDVGWKFARYGELSERQIEAVTRAIERETGWRVEREERAAREAAEPKVPAPEGRQVVTGEILSTKWVDSQWGGATKMLVKDDRGFRVWCTMPSDLAIISGENYSTSAGRGDRVEFTVTLEQSDDDETFAWGKRPSKGKILEAVT